MELPGNLEFNASFFDNASKEWRANKRQKPRTGTFVYTINECTHIKKNGKKCTNRTISNSELCKYHR